jgi:hypothetical protein
LLEWKKAGKTTKEDVFVKQGSVDEVIKKLDAALHVKNKEELTSLIATIIKENRIDILIKWHLKQDVATYVNNIKDSLSTYQVIVKRHKQNLADQRGLAWDIATLMTKDTTQATHTAIEALQIKLFKLEEEEEVIKAVRKENGDNLMKEIYVLGKRIENITDVDGVTLDGIPLKDVLKKDILLQTLDIDDDIYNDITRKKQILDYVGDIDDPKQAYDLENNGSDGFTDFEINERISETSDPLQTLYENYKYFGHLKNIKIIDKKHKNLYIMDHFWRKNLQGKHFYTSKTVPFEWLYKTDLDALGRGVQSINSNPNIQVFKINRDLMRTMYDSVNTKKLASRLWNLDKDVTIISEWLDEQFLQAFITKHNENVLSKDISENHTFTYTPSKLSSLEANLIFMYRGSISLPNCKYLPFATYEEWEKALTNWKELNPTWGTIDIGVLDLWKFGRKALANTFNPSTAAQYTVKVNNVDDVQSEYIPWINRINANLEMNALSGISLGDDAEKLLEFWRPPQKGWFMRDSDLGKKEYFDRYNSSQFKKFDGLTDNQLRHYVQDNYCPAITLGSGNTSEKHIDAFLKNKNLTTLWLMWDQLPSWKDIRRLAKKLQTFIWYEVTTLADEEDLDALSSFKNLVLPKAKEVWTTIQEDKKDKNKEFAKLISWSNNISFGSITELNEWMVRALQKKSGGIVDFVWAPGAVGLTTLKIYNPRFDMNRPEKDQSEKKYIIITAENAENYKKELASFLKRLHKTKSGVKIRLGGIFEMIDEDYLYIKNN